MEYLLDLGFTNDDITILNGTVEASVLEKLKIFKTLVKVNYDYIKSLGIKNNKEVFMNHTHMFFINPDRFMVKKYRDGSLKDGVIKENEVIGYNFDIIDIAGKPHMLLNENDIKFVAEEYEFYETEENKPRNGGGYRSSGAGKEKG